jgi:hypothetical protein
MAEKRKSKKISEAKLQPLEFCFKTAFFFHKRGDKRTKGPRNMIFSRPLWW